MSSGDTHRKIEISLEMVKQNRSISFCKNVGFPGLFMHIIAIFIACAMFFLTLLYTNYFSFKRSGIEVFVGISALYLLSSLYHCLFWRKLARKTMQETEENDKKKKKESEKKNAILVILKRGRDLLDKFEINGDWFLIKMYASEIVESCVQCYNLLVLYTCVCPPLMLLGFCLFLGLDHVIRLYSLWQPYTSSSRDTQFLIDLCVDILCAALPLTFITFIFDVPMSLSEVALLLLWPSLSSLSKLFDLMEENVWRRTHLDAIKREMRASSKLRRRRQSMFSKNSLEIGLERQKSYIGKKIKIAISIFTGLMAIFFVVVGTLAFTVKVECADIWQKGCRVKLRFCHMKTACDCAVFHLDKHNLTEVPVSLNKMENVRSLRITRGPLKQVASLVHFRQLAKVNFSENLLSQVPALPLNILRVEIEKNNISSIPSLTKFENLFLFFASYNKVSAFPSVGRNIVELRLQNNSMRSITKTGNIVILDVGGNQIETLPEYSDVQILYISNNNLTVLPLWEYLTEVDARHNKLANLPDITPSQIWLYGNPLCENGWVPNSEALRESLERDGTGCSKQCSNTCINEHRGGGTCELECYSDACNFDDGDCNDNGAYHWV